MKKIKILLSLLVIFIGFIFIGEYSMFCIDDLSKGLPNTTFYYQPGINHNEMKEEILNSAEKYKVSFFIIKDDLKSTSEKNRIIYTSNVNVKQWLNENKNIEEKKYQSMFMGVTNVLFSDYINVDDDELELNNMYYVIGDKGDIEEFKKSLIDKYAGNHPNFPDLKYKYEYTFYIVWGIIGCFSLLLTLAYVEFLKKEVSLKMIYGENIWKVILKEISIDILTLSLCSLFIPSVLNNYTNSGFRIDIFYKFLLIFTVVNSFIYVLWKKFEIKNIYKSEKNLGKITSLLYFVKLVTLVLVTLMLTSNIIMIKESMIFLSQEKFFKEHSNYYYTNINYIPRETIDESKDKGLEESAYIKEVFYRKYFKEFSPIMLVNLGEINSNELIMVNKYSLNYLKEQIKSLNNKTLESKYYYILPTKTKNNSNLIKLLDLRLENYDEENNFKNKDIIYYDENIELVTIDDMLPLGSRLSKNPIIILNNMDIEYVPENIKGYPFKTVYDRDIMYKIDENQFNLFIDEYKLKTEVHSKTNVYKKYQDGKLVMSRILKMAFVMSVILVILELIVLLTLIKLEFRLNSYKIAIKKILGYAVWERYLKLFIFSTLSILMAQIIFVVVSFIMGLTNLYILGSIIIFLLFVVEQVIVYLEIKKIEKNNINLVLKGEFQ